MNFFLIFCTAICIFPAVISFFNLLTAPKLSRADQATHRAFSILSTSLLIPVRNESSRLNILLSTLQNLNANPQFEILFLDDESQDETKKMIETAGFQVISGKPLPDGWVGKNWACFQLAKEAKGDVLIFMDADVLPTPTALEKTASLIASRKVDALSALPFQSVKGLLEKSIIPWIMHLSIVGTVPLWVSNTFQWISMTVANGQWLAFHKETYWNLLEKGHAEVQGSALEDMALAKKVREKGGVFHTYLAADVLSVRMYETKKELTDGFTKNLFLLAGKSTVGIVLIATVVLIWAFFPVIAFFAEKYSLAGLSLLALISFRISVSIMFHSKGVDLLLHPIGALGTVGLLFISTFQNRSKTVFWKGRKLK